MTARQLRLPNPNAPADRRAQNAAQKALERGEIVAPEACEVCGRTDKRLVQHHEDYSRPLDTTFVCDRCHRLIHGKRTQAARMAATA